MVHITEGRGDFRPRHDNRDHRGNSGPRKIGCDNEISLVSRLIARGARITVTSTVHEKPISGVVIWSDLNNICIKDDSVKRAPAIVWVFAKRHLADWSFDAAYLDG